MNGTLRATLFGGILRGVPRLRSKLHVVLAGWVLRRIHPEDAVRLAGSALEDGCSDSSIAAIAGSNATSRAEIEEELAHTLRRLGTRLPSEAEALKVLVDDCAKQIVSGEIEPLRGAWRMFDFWANEDESAAFQRQVRAFTDLAVGSEVPGCDHDTLRHEILKEACAFLSRGGLDLAALDVTDENGR
jgi:hypothetical protein